MTLPRTLFVARGSSGIAWYRCALPASALGADWASAPSAARPSCASSPASRRAR